jgi:hypothetical protein
MNQCMVRERMNVFEKKPLNNHILCLDVDKTFDEMKHSKGGRHPKETTKRRNGLEDSGYVLLCFK